MIIAKTNERSDEGELVCLARQARHEFANLHARHIGGHWPELAPYFRGRIGFEIKRIEVRWATRQ
jgi:hypothetical protein